MTVTTGYQGPTNISLQLEGINQDPDAAIVFNGEEI